MSRRNPPRPPRFIQTSGEHGRLLAAFSRAWEAKERLRNPEAETWRCVGWAILVLIALAL